VSVPCASEKGASLRGSTEAEPAVIEDITAADFDPMRYGASMQELMGRSTGAAGRTLLKGMEYFACVRRNRPWLAAGTHEVADPEIHFRRRLCMVRPEIAFV